MTSGINGPGGPRGPGGAGGPTGVDAADEPEAAAEAGAPMAAHAADASAAVGDTGGIDRIAADLDAGRITGREALDRLIDEAVPGELALDEADRAELRAAMAELLANDPHLAALAARIGAAGSGSES